MGILTTQRSASRASASFRWAALPIYLTAIADTFGGLVHEFLPVSLLIRAMLIVYFIAYMFRTNSPAGASGSILIWVVALGYFLFSPIVHYLLLLDERALGVEVSSALRLLYFPLLLNYLLKESEKGALGPNAVMAGLLLYGYLVLASLALGEWSGLGGTIGGRGSSIEAGKGFMIGANEVGLMLLLTCSFVVADLVLRSRSRVVGACSGIFVYLLAGGYVFTKSSLAASLLGSVAAYRQFMRGGPGLRLVVNTVLVVGISFAALRIADYVGPLLDALAQTFFAALLDDGLVAFLMRGRESYIEAIVPGLVDHDLAGAFVLFGAGEWFVRELSVVPLGLERLEGTTFEMDLFDLVACHGLIGLLLYGMLIRMLLGRGRLLRAPLEVVLAIAGVLLHSVLAGHVLYSPQVTTILALVIVLYNKPEVAWNPRRPLR